MRLKLVPSEMSKVVGTSAMHYYSLESGYSRVKLIHILAIQEYAKKRGISAVDLYRGILWKDDDSRQAVGGAE